MAKVKRVSNHTVQTLWTANDIKPHLKRTFKLSEDENFETTLGDVIA